MVLDFAVNDGHVTPLWRDRDGYSFTNGARMGFEQLVRALRRAVPCCASMPVLGRMQCYGVKPKWRLAGGASRPKGAGQQWPPLSSCPALQPHPNPTLAAAARPPVRPPARRCASR